jgi:antirestriction protein
MEDEFRDEGADLYSAYVNHYGSHYVANDEPHEVVERIRDAYQGTFRDREAWADDYAESTGMLDSVPENLRHYFDMDAFARDCEINGDVSFEPGGDGVLAFRWD